MVGLVERFNQTLKQMLRRVAAEDKWDWNLMLPYVLFGIREVPQASTGFTPFELLFGRQPRGLLDIAREQQQPTPLRSVVDPVREMRERIERVMPLVREHLVKAQQSQQRLYNRAAQPREFQPGDKVMVLVPTAACKFLATWQGLYTVIEQVGPSPTAWPKTKRTTVSHKPPEATNVIEHDIRTAPGVIVRQRPYRVPEARRQAIEDEISEMLKLGVIEPSRSVWSSPIVMVPKPDGTLRFCNDFRRLNQVSEFDSYPMPRVDKLLERLGRAQFISTLDLTKGYWQVPLMKAAKEKTAFSTPSGHWQYRTLPFGLHGAPATFQRMMDVLL
ncbi:Transposon Ty3-I Gag-Pol polyprotein [Labeo rohita]|uniref:ribonuclease H n=1 Tax=Labeo rohita TaxID=84645 RepID=A0ABQ8KYX9_LABRO|nr:Transposon Ty3-I Gag-Pol polyprotein [Labeo rohita]